MSKPLLMSLMMLAANPFAAAAPNQAQDCQEAEAALSEIAVYLAEGFNATDLEAVQAAMQRAVDQVEKSENAVQRCTCQPVAQNLPKVRDVLEGAQDDNDAGDLQGRFQRAVEPAEMARFAAEQCWRDAASALSGAAKLTQ